MNTPAARREYYWRNRDQVLEMKRKWMAEHPEHKEKDFARYKLIRDRAKKVIAKLDELESCDMAEILFAEST